VTPGDIQRVAEEFLKPDRLSIVLVGDADRFVSQLRGAGFDKFERVALADLDLSTADLKRRAASPGGELSGPSDAEPSPPAVAFAAAQAADERARAILAKAIEARGGLEKLRSIKTLRAIGTTTVMGPQGAIKIETTTSVVYPDRVRVEGALPTGRVVQVYASGVAWIWDPNGIRDAPPAMRDGMRADLERDTVHLLLDAWDGKAKLGAPADVSAESGKPRAAIESVSEGREPVTLHFDLQTGHMMGVTYKVPAPAGQRSTMELRLSDFRSVDGLMIPFTAATLRDGVMAQERTFTKVEINATIDSAVFTKPVG
jgi:hypothetical protein